MSTTQSGLSSLLLGGLIPQPKSSEPQTNETKTYDAIAIVEMPQGSTLKYEMDKADSTLMLDRVLNQPVPYNYGFVPNTLCGDGDPLDVFILGDTPIYPLAKVKIKIIGALKCNDNGSDDDKLIAIIDGEDTFASGVGIDIIRTYLGSYKTGFNVLEQLDKEAALKVYEESKALYTKDWMDAMKAASERFGCKTNEQDSGT